MMYVNYVCIISMYVCRAYVVNVVVVVVVVIVVVDVVDVVDVVVYMRVS